MISILVVSPVGTSLFRNASDPNIYKKPSVPQNYEDVIIKYKVSSLVSLPLSDPRNEFDVGEVCRYIDKPDLVSSLEWFINKNPKTSCAELAGFYRILDDVKARYGKPLTVFTILYPTATCNSYLASRVIEKHLKSQGVSVKVEVVKAIKSEKEFDEGLASLIDVVARDIVDFSRKGFKVYVNATPGFKPEVSFLVLISPLLGVNSVYYIHEAFREIVRLPILPISIKKEYLNLMKKIAEEGGVELRDAYGILGLSESNIRDLEDMFIAYVEGTRLKPRIWVTKLLEMLDQLKR
ncbi:MAG: putative CRISPR-associated protein [Sulfolobales archaeon]|nr:putative CRISPR-associated protein [Sulfolobales archaeon]